MPTKNSFAGVLTKELSPDHPFQPYILKAQSSKILVIKCLFLCLTASPIFAQQLDSVVTSTTYVYLDDIVVTGNRKTKAWIILRELEFAKGDSLSVADLPATLERNRLRLMNTGLFSSAKIEMLPVPTPQRLRLQITVVETWYIYPIPLFELADRNFNVWWDEFHHSLRRVNYGIDLSYLNLTGHADGLKVKGQFGYNNRYELSYRFPPFNREGTIGMQTSVAYSRTHEVGYLTTGNKVLFYRNSELWMFRQIAATANFFWRPKLLSTHTFTFEYRDNRISDTIAKTLNPDFFLGGSTRQHHFSAVYRYATDHRDIKPYPLHGWHAVVEARQNGLLPTDDLHLSRLFAEYNQYFSFNKKLSLEMAFKGRTTLPRSKPPYYNNQALGYGGSFVRGYEYYVADGLDYFVTKTALHFNLFDRNFNLGKWMPVKAFQVFPLKLYLSFNNDVGYANDPWYRTGNPVSNRWLYGYGVGLDFVAYYDKTARIEWSCNDLGQRGFYIQINTGL